jgi:predicted ATPase
MRARISGPACQELRGAPPGLGGRPTNGGEIEPLLSQPNAAKALAHFARALSVARAQRAQSWELRAAMSMARLWKNQERREEARGLFAPIHGWFKEGFDTLDLRETKALLNTLASANLGLP